jgi:hypothetical protein
VRRWRRALTAAFRSELPSPSSQSFEPTSCVVSTEHFTSPCLSACRARAVGR